MGGGLDVSLLAKQGVFTTTAAAAGNTQAITGLGFQPKLVIFWWSGAASETDALTGSHALKGFGVASSSTSRWAVTTQAGNASAAADCDMYWTDAACIATLATNGTVDGLIDFQSMDGDGFTLIVDDNFGTLRRIEYLALGGADLTDIALGRFTGSGATGTQDVTSVGFQPDLVMFGTVGSATDPPSGSTSSNLGVGAAASASQMGTLVGFGFHNQDPTVTWGYSFGGEAIGTPGSSIHGRATLDSFLSNGFRLNWLEATGAKFFYLALKGGSYRVGNFVTSTTINDTIVETGFGFTPKGTLLFSNGRAQDTQNVNTNHDQFNIGGFSSTTNRGVQGSLDEHGVGTSDTEYYILHAAAMAQIRVLATPVIAGEVDVQSIDADGFTLVMDSAANPAAFVWYISFGDTPSAGVSQKPNATTSNDGWDTAPLAGQAIHTYIATDDSDYITVTV